MAYTCTNMTTTNLENNIENECWYSVKVHTALLATCYHLQDGIPVDVGILL